MSKVAVTWFVVREGKIIGEHGSHVGAVKQCRTQCHDERSKSGSSIVKPGLYKYLGPYVPDQKQVEYWVGTRETLIEKGFGAALEEWDVIKRR